MKLAIFDFDGTITAKDSFIEFILYAQGIAKTAFGFFILSPVLLLYHIRLIPNFKAKQIVFNYFFGGWEEKRFKSISESFAQDRLPGLIRKSAFEKIKWHKENGHELVVVSASLNCYLDPWCESYQLVLIATGVEYKNNKVTGRFSTKNCYGKEKVSRLLEFYNLEKFEYIYAYGDSEGDEEILRLANNASKGEFR
ncbi:MAG: hypothetical protein A2Z88_06495 [Omnitrophica WOR_2 bacterium GWA2_47_8]|nr:MAG: hypothetical protein A2Z88_06495 [Omnitrophica WOR_2 bacterium GWA2_47_8]